MAMRAQRSLLIVAVTTTRTETVALKSTPNDAIYGAAQGDRFMRSTINIDDGLMEKARSLTGTKETAAIVRQALETLVRVETGKRLIALGGTMPDAEAAPRRRSEAAE
jgi:Arc/MetJ family transcription regulator